MKASDYLKTMDRMCRQYPDCSRWNPDKDGNGSHGTRVLCPILKEFNTMYDTPCELSCLEFQYKHADEAERIVEEWAAAHPLVTNAMKFKEVFGKASEWIGDTPWLDVLEWLDEPYTEKEDDDDE